MACEQSRVWCRDTAPLCNQEGQALWARSPNQFLTVPVEPAAGKTQEEILYFQNLENNLDRSPPKKETVPGIVPGQAAQLACRLAGGLSWSLWEVD